MYTGKLVFATNNKHKMEEAKHILSSAIQLFSLQEVGCLAELPATHETIEENAVEKASYLFQHFKTNCLSDDTCLEVAALHGAPGVYSARCS